MGVENLNQKGPGEGMGNGVDAVQELGKYFSLMKIIAGESLSSDDLKHIEAGNENVSELAGESSNKEDEIIAALQAKGITPSNNEVVRALVKYSGAKHRLNEAMKVTSPSAELMDKKVQLREDLRISREELAEMLNSWTPLITGAF